MIFGLPHVRSFKDFAPIIENKPLGDLSMADTLYFTAGQLAALTALFTTSPSGQPIDVPDAQVQIFGSGGDTIMGPVSMVQVVTGFYFYDWVIPNSTPVGAYTVKYSGTVLGVPTASIGNIQVFPYGTPAGVTMTPQQVAMVAGLETYLGCMQAIPVYSEVSRRNATKSEFQFTFPRWNMGNHTVFVNDEEVTSGFAIDTDAGRVRFDAPLLDSDAVRATYTFRFFSSTDLLRFINDAINNLNVGPPLYSWTPETLPPQMFGVIMQGAAALAIQKLLMCWSIQQIRKIFGDKDAQAVQSNWQSLKQNYEEQFKELRVQAKISRYPTPAAVIAPEYTLPGGRSRWFRYLFSSSLG
jgi:hypothetical protein